MIKTMKKRKNKTIRKNNFYQITSDKVLKYKKTIKKKS